MNLLLHGIGRLANDYEPCIEIRDPLSSSPTDHFDLVITNPPFGSESREASSRGDFWIETRSNPLGYLQQARSMLEMDCRARGVRARRGPVRGRRRRDGAPTSARGVRSSHAAAVPDGTSYAGSKAIDCPTPEALCLVTFVSRAWPEAFDEVLDVGGGLIGFFTGVNLLKVRRS
jgi:hypothetical protein